MTQPTAEANEPTLQLPAAAPQVRVTAGVGSAGQKTWNLRRPVTLIGSRRPAHIILHDQAVSDAHCVIVNTGTEVLLKDLHTNSGTFCRNAKVDIIVLKDGDVITVGESRIQVAIHMPEETSGDSACGVTYADPTRLATPLSIGLVHTDQRWNIEEAVVLIGGHPAATILLDNEEVSRRHALIFRFSGGVALFDLGGRGGLWINGRQVSISALLNGDRITIGPFGLQVGVIDAASTDARATGSLPSGDNSREHDRESSPGVVSAAALPSVVPDAACVDEPPPAGGVSVECEMDALQRKITGSWERLNAWQTQLLADAGALSKQGTDLAAKEAEIEARDAALRGQLHDVTRYSEQLLTRERALAAEFARLQAEKDKLTADQTALAKREAEIVRRLEELPRREHVLAQRWSRLQAATCPHCGEPIGTLDAGPKD